MRVRISLAKKAAMGLLLALPLVTSTGCIVYRPYRRPVVVQCRPNEYWDGEMCRHKGHGASPRGY